MRWSVFFLISGFVLMSLYIGGVQGAFAFKRHQMDLPPAKEEVSKNETPALTKTEELAAAVKEPLKSQLVALINERKLDKAAKLYEAQQGKNETSVTYGILLKLAEKKAEQ